jgi:penicillin-insensitive murein endopeptidase
VVRAVLAVVALLTGCAELGVVTDGSSISVGRTSRGYLVDARKLPDDGPGFTTREVWKVRNNRFGTDEMIDMIEGVAKRMHRRFKDVRLVVADISSQTGGGAFAFHRSHQDGRDADILYYMRDKDGNPFEPDAMHVFDRHGRARDGSGLTIDVPRTWQLVKYFATAPEATVQYIFMYEPIAQLLIDHAKKIGEPLAVITKVRRALRQPGDSARHDDHLHVRIYCAPTDREYGCEDFGPMELLAEREAEQKQILASISSGMHSAPADEPAAPEAPPSLTEVALAKTQSSVVAAAPPVALVPPGAPFAAPGTTPPAGAPTSTPPAITGSSVTAVMGASTAASLSSMFRARLDRVTLLGWH